MDPAMDSYVLTSDNISCRIVIPNGDSIFGGKEVLLWLIT